MRNESYVLVEFTIAPGEDHAGERDFFVGASLRDVFGDTHGGRQFGNAQYSEYRPVTLDDVRAYDFEHLDKSIAAIVTGDSKSLWIGSTFGRAPALTQATA